MTTLPTADEVARAIERLTTRLAAPTTDGDNDCLLCQGRNGHYSDCALVIVVAAARGADAKDAAMLDALSGWRYIRKVYGDLSGVGWDRVEDKLIAALAAKEYPSGCLLA